MRLRALLFAGCVAGCITGCAVVAPAAPQVARPDAPTGRLAGAPAALRAGVISYPDVPAVQTAPPVHHHHHP